MSSLRAALIAAIREAPDDDVPRLVCADWFEEQGDPASVARAEFIRTQIQQAKLPPDDVSQSELQARELRLLKRWAPVWCGSHFVFRKVRFRRGFIEYVHLHLQHFLHHRRQMLTLEPVRDISLTGWFRAPDDLVRRVAACPEWKHIETLRIHHQGPHKAPRGNLVDLLESPHLTGLRVLHCPHVQFDADARRRFERLPILRRLRELRFPTLDTLMEQPGEWFSDGGTVFANQWDELKSIVLPFVLSIDLLRRLSEMPFWNRLSGIEMCLPDRRDVPQALSILRDRMPLSLQEFRLESRQAPADYSEADSLFQRLAQAPLQSLHLDIPLSTETLRRMLDGTNQWNLRELSLIDGISEDHARIIAGSPGVKSLRSLDLSLTGVGSDGARALFSSDYLRSLVHLNLSGDTRIGSAGASVLAETPGWDCLRWLNLSDTGLEDDGLRMLLASPNLHHLNGLTIGGGGWGGEPIPYVPPDLATEITQLPHLVSLRLNVLHCDPRSRQILTESDSLAWVTIDCEDDTADEFRRIRAPDRRPPLDDAWEPLPPWM